MNQNGSEYVPACKESATMQAGFVLRNADNNITTICGNCQGFDI